ncbi:MAG TPA: 16S rRNA (adenine(1518)-N(6)/adenine(1519)-N(6))-dimethyltransferase RsmA [bacterium]|nr:16S rRNA (adenine(1518)-N(6)/adenine(1519)-N(6))-dimethyltransferase RsmA [bacterium]
MDLRSLKDILRDNGIRLKKRWGQNFLCDEAIIADIVRAANVAPGDLVVEVGPGIGTLTERILDTGADVVAVDIDPKLTDVLGERFAGNKRLRVVTADILAADLRELAGSGADGQTRPFTVIANLPYYITSTILMLFLESGLPIRRMVCTMQQEVAARVTACPGTKTYGILSVFSQFYSRPSVVRKIGAHAFFPVPEVDSAVVRFDDPARPAVEVRDKAVFAAVVKTAFGQRRKTIRNNLMRLDGFEPAKTAALLAACRIDPARRAETLSLEEFARIADWISQTRKR